MFRLPLIWVLALLLGLNFIINNVSEGFAGVCGGTTPCNCGDTVNGVAVLAKNLGICPGTGLRLISSSTLDCAGYKITGSNLSNAKYGVVLDKALGAEVKNCRVSGFRRNIRLVGGSANIVQGNEVFGGKYGMDLADATAGNLITANLVRNNRDEGIHVGANANNNAISHNTFDHNKAEHIYLLNVHGCQVTDNLLKKSGKAAIFVKHSNTNTVSRNTISDGPIHLRGHSFANVIQQNQLSKYGYLFEAYEELTGWTYPHDNIVTGGSIKKAAICVSMKGAYNNTVDQVQVSQCGIQIKQLPLGGQDSTGNIINLIPVP
jgi:parallel beta-helix repeat protein